MDIMDGLYLAQSVSSRPLLKFVSDDTQYFSAISLIFCAWRDVVHFYSTEETRAEQPLPIKTNKYETHFALDHDTGFKKLWCVNTLIH